MNNIDGELSFAIANFSEINSGAFNGPTVAISSPERTIKLASI